MDSDIKSVLVSASKLLANLPNAVPMLDAQAIAFGDMSNAVTLVHVYLEKFISGDNAAGRQYLAMTKRASSAISLLSVGSEGHVSEACILTQRALIAATKHFEAVIQARMGNLAN